MKSVITNQDEEGESNNKVSRWCNLLLDHSFPPLVIIAKKHKDGFKGRQKGLYKSPLNT